MMKNLFHDLYGVDAPAQWEAYSAPQSPITGLKEGMEGVGDYGRKLQKKKAREKLKGNGKGEEMENGNNAN